MKKFVALLLALLMCVSLIPTMAMAAGETTIKSGTFKSFYDRVSGEYLRTEYDDGTSHNTVSLTISSREFSQIQDTYVVNSSGETMSFYYQVTYSPLGVKQIIEDNGERTERSVPLQNLNTIYNYSATNVNAPEGTVTALGVNLPAGEYIVWDAMPFYFTDFDDAGKAQTIYDPYGNVYVRTGDVDGGDSLIAEVISRVMDINASIIAALTTLFTQIISVLSRVFAR